jgi:hypothetical protein
MVEHTNKENCYGMWRFALSEHIYVRQRHYISKKLTNFCRNERKALTKIGAISLFVFTCAFTQTRYIDLLSYINM